MDAVVECVFLAVVSFGFTIHLLFIINLRRSHNTEMFFFYRRQSRECPRKSTSITNGFFRQGRVDSPAVIRQSYLLVFAQKFKSPRRDYGLPGQHHKHVSTESAKFSYFDLKITRHWNKTIRFSKQKPWAKSASFFSVRHFSYSKFVIGN